MGSLPLHDAMRSPKRFRPFKILLTIFPCDVLRPLLNWLSGWRRHFRLQVEPYRSGYQVSVLPTGQKPLYVRAFHAAPAAFQRHAALVAAFRQAGWTSVGVSASAPSMRRAALYVIQAPFRSHRERHRDADHCTSPVRGSIDGWRCRNDRAARRPMSIFPWRIFCPGAFPYGDACSISAFSSAPTRIAERRDAKLENKTIPPPLCRRSPHSPVKLSHCTP